MRSEDEIDASRLAMVDVPRSLGVHMTGSEWFGSNPGGLGRYFSGLYAALRGAPGVNVSAAAFGTPDLGGSTWGPTNCSTLKRVATSFTSDMRLPNDVILDRHFSLFGRPSIGPRGKNPLVVHFHGPWAAESAATGASARSVHAKMLVERARYVGADRFIVLSNHSRNILVRDYLVSEDKVDIVPPGVDLNKFNPRMRRPGAGPPTVICVRRLEARMGIDVLLNAWPLVVAAHPEARLVIVGEGSEEESLKAQADAMGLGQSVRFEGRASDSVLAQLYSESTVSVVPSVALEGFGLIALESLATGCPPIVTDCGGLPDAVAGLDASLIVPAGNAKALAERLRAALEGQVPDSTTCRAYAEKFSWQASAENHVDIYRAVIR